MEFYNMMILIAGPYRSGTGDDPARWRQSESAGKCRLAAVPEGPCADDRRMGGLADLAECRRQDVGDALYEQILHPTAHRLLERCEAVLRLPGASKGADNDVKIAKERGIPVYYSLDEVPWLDPLARIKRVIWRIPNWTHPC